MNEDLPIYAGAKLRTGLQFADVEKYRSQDATPIWEKSDTFIEQMEGASNVSTVRMWIALTSGCVSMVIACATMELNSLA